MPYQCDQPINLKIIKDDDCHIVISYIASSQHRQAGHPIKSIWRINIDDEVNCFANSIKQQWVVGAIAWGIQFIGGIMSVLGHSPDGDELKIAKFIDGNNRNCWHGYPANILSNPHDIPSTKVLAQWVESGFITKAKMSKIRQGKICNL